MDAASRDSRQLLEQTAAQLRRAVAELAAQLRPFPAFWGMSSVQAIELEPPPSAAAEWGCIVLLPRWRNLRAGAGGDPWTGRAGGC